MPTELKIPSIGESVTEAEITRWLKNEGDAVRKDETVAELETEKASFELPAPASGTLGKRLKDEGETAEVGEVIGHINGEGEGEDESKNEKKQAKQSKKQDAKSKRQDKEPKKKREAEADSSSGDQEEAGEAEEAGKPEAGDAKPRISPLARRLIEEYGLDAKQIKGSGPGGRIMKDDALRAAGQIEDTQEAEGDEEDAGEAGAPDETAEPKRRPADGREEQVVRMSVLRRHIAKRLVEAQHNAALLTTFNEIDMSAVMNLRKTHGEAFQEKHGVKLGFMSFFVKAAIDALKQFPGLNAVIDDESIVYRNYYDIGIAVSTERGLVVPVIRDAHLLSFAEIEKTINDFGERARNFDLSPDELQGGTFTITNGGIFGSLMSTPIVNPPQSGVLGMHTIQKRPVVVDDDDRIEARPMMYIALTYDHRIVDGREAVLCLRRIKETLETPSRMLIEA
ncbi:MAG: 2-oxoglutarate dehydrogenase complex dihydrolipoyllysine-residue succinyltransferase [Planctomycetes bacterium]|jgi:2-oxoglutarate dehydrogenase E2 component (dihydrolipoamide succinyltransferase)|nr:2-oxoglutarate dehydrogenase complex dihydrolipoyllysine-residue succinyltransferase [Planctomycetota bacterium]